MKRVHDNHIFVDLTDMELTLLTTLTAGPMSVPLVPGGTTSSKI